MDSFVNSFEYKVIYVFEIKSESHNGFLKIGDTTLHSNKSVDNLPPNCSDLNLVAKKRIKEYTNTAGFEFTLLHTELAIRTEKKGQDVFLKAFRDHNIHKVLVNSNFNRQVINGTTGREWFKINLTTALKAIEAVKMGVSNIEGSDTTNSVPIIFRPEQEEAITKTIKNFKSNNRMLWNAKMRFGKTLTALEVIKKCKFEKTIIITHRPVVDSGWFEDFHKIFNIQDDYVYGSKKNGDAVENLLSLEKKIVYFVSIQDLRGSSIVGGKIDKNDDIFSTYWDFVIVDEAHEGTTTYLGDEVIKQIFKEDSSYNTKLLALSGTPFNIIGNYDDNIYTWDYMMEQKQKIDWDNEFFGDSNPYDELPKMQIYTYDIGNIINSNKYKEIEDKAFNFKEFFRTYTGDAVKDSGFISEGKSIGDFIHKSDVESFLNLMTKEDSKSLYPFSNDKYRDIFRHTLWMVPGVKEAQALSTLLKAHKIFGNGSFNIVNVAGDGDEEDKYDDALKKVTNAIKNTEDGYTITISCGKLTTGVTIPEWTGVLMLSGSTSTSASSYLQTIFRVQSPCNTNGKIKRNGFVFDFAPDRALKMVADSITLSTKAGKTSTDDRITLGNFINYCPIISIDGTKMKEYNSDKLLQQLKIVYAERAVRNGFDDNNLYSDELLKLDGLALEDFEELKKIIGVSKSIPKLKNIDINKQGFTDEEYEQIEKIGKKPKKERTKEEEELLKEVEEKKKQKNNAIAILRAISIRMPLLIYGADVKIDDDFTIDKFLDDNIVDQNSWEEFMPANVSKDLFKKFIKFYDPDVFVSAGRAIRLKMKAADEMCPLDRINVISEIFSNFKNPDKETVLTPWRVVNMHVNNCFGGYNFYNNDFSSLLEKPNYVEINNVTKQTLSNKNAKVLEINSKTGLYPLLVTYNIFMARCEDYTREELTIDLQNKLWYETVINNLFIICKTPMARQITKRTLVGYNDTKINAQYFEKLVNMMENKPKQFKERVIKSSYWNFKGEEKMKFDAILGNPPYMEMDGGAQASAKPIYQHFVTTAKQLEPNYLSFIMPTRWYAGGKGLDQFRDEMLNDIRIESLYDCMSPEDIFPNTNIRGGVCFFLWNKEYDNSKQYTKVVTLEKDKEIKSIHRPMKLPDINIFIRHSEAISILEKVMNISNKFIDSIVSSRKPFGYSGNFVKDLSFKASAKELYEPVMCYAKAGQIGFVEKNEIPSHKEWIDVWKVLTPRANNIGTELSDDNFNSFPVSPGSVCTESYIVIGSEIKLDEKSAKNLSSYMRTKFARFLHSLAKASHDAPSKTYRFIPIVNFTDEWNDVKLYQKYGLTNEEIEFIESSIKSMT